MIELRYPITHYDDPVFQALAGGANFKPITTQSFGENAVPFYAQLGLKGHNGVDYTAPIGTEVYASHDGEITKTYDKTNASVTIGFGVWIMHPEGWYTVYFHLKDVNVKVGDKVKAGDLIGWADNTGQYTTGSHLHFGLYPKDRDRNNGYDGAIDPLPYFITKPKDMPILTKDSADNQYIVFEEARMAWSIPEPATLLEIKAFLKIKTEAVKMDLTGYFIIHGNTAKNLKNYFNL